MEEKTINALKWIVEILNKKNIPFQIGGGFAARMYGVERPLADIDITIPTDLLPEIREEVKDYLTHDLRHFIDPKWEATGLTVEYNGQVVDFVGAQDKKIFDEKTNAWLPLENDFSKSQFMEIQGLKISVVPKDFLINYKKILLREVDKEDLKGLSK